MEMANPARYAVIDRKNGQVVCEGASHVCARCLGVTYESFFTLASRSKNGKWRYRIERIDKEPDTAALARSWDTMRKQWKMELAHIPYPCQGCMVRSICEFQDTYCQRWKRWYQAEHDRVAALLRREAKGIVR